MAKVLGKHICWVIFAINKVDFDMTHSYDVTDIVIPDVNMLDLFSVTGLDVIKIKP